MAQEGDGLRIGGRSGARRQDAGSTVSQNFESARKASAKRLAEMGVNPNSGVMQAAERESAVQEGGGTLGGDDWCGNGSQGQGHCTAGRRGELRAKSGELRRPEPCAIDQHRIDAAGTAGAGINSALASALPLPAATECSSRRRTLRFRPISGLAG